MAKLYFKYGAMGSSKTAQALITRFNYIERGIGVWLIKPSIDTRDDTGAPVLHSRIGLEAPVCAVSPDDDILELFGKHRGKIGAIISDEAQFFTEKQILQLRTIASDEDIPVLCYGLRTDFRTKLFSGSKALFELADSIAEIKSVCSCGEKASVNARLDGSGNVITDGEQIVLGGNDLYEPMCWTCWNKRKRGSVR